MRRLRPEVVSSGDIYHTDGRHLGKHSGLYQFTIGQRRRLGIATEGAPLYVVGLDVERSRLIVGPRAECSSCQVSLQGLHWIGGKPEQSEVLVRLRSTQAPHKARIKGDKVILETPQLGVARGQACVFYQKCDKNKLEVLGGGWIGDSDLSSRFSVA